MRRILLVGASGAFGARLASMLARWPDIELVLAARRTGPLAALAATLTGPARVEVTAFDREAPEVAALRPWAVVDTAGPFQTSDLRLAEAAIEAGAHYVDIADSRTFVAGFPSALDAPARAAGVLAITGASSTPALSNAALDALATNWRRIDSTVVAIAPGARAPRGRAVIRAILSYVGQPVRVFATGRWTHRPGWSGLNRVYIPRIGRRWASLCETPDLDLIPQRFAVTREALFLGGLEQGGLHLGLWLLAWLVRLRLVSKLTPLADLLRRAAGVAAVFGSDRGGMVITAVGEGADGTPREARWSLAAYAGAGPHVPVAAAAAALRGLADGRITVRGAHACVGLLGLEAILAELAHLPITTETLVACPTDPTLFRSVLGEAFDHLPPTVRRLHGATGPATYAGRGRARGARNHLMRLARWVLGLPGPGVYPRLIVHVAPKDSGETWTRTFGDQAFTSHLGRGGEFGQFEERFGPMRLTFEAVPFAYGFRWRFVGMRFGPVAVPRVLAPRIHAAAFESAGVYRFSVAVAHPWLGVLFAYAGRLD